MMENKLFEIRVLYFDKNGVEVDRSNAHSVRLSLLFDSNNYHVQFPAKADIKEVARYLNDMVERLHES